MIKITSRDTANTLHAYHLETTNYCSGTGSTKNTPTELVEGDLTATDTIHKFIPGIAKPSQVNVYGLNAGRTPTATCFDGYKLGEGSLVADLQTDDFFDIAVNGTIGAIPYSLDWRYNDGTSTEKDLYGCLPTEYSLKSVAGAQGNPPVVQNLSWLTAQSKTASTTPIAGGGIPAYQSGARAVWSGVSATIDSITSANLIMTEVELKIVKKYNVDTYANGLKYIQEPTLAEMIPTITISTIEEASNTWFVDEMNETQQLVDGNIVWGSMLTTTFTNYNVKMTNLGDIESRGLIRNKYEFEGGVGWTLS